MPSRHVTLSEVERYICTQMRAALQKDLLTHRMIREGDLECCAYHHLRGFLKGDGRWRVFARKYSGAIGRYPDLTIVMDLKPRIAVELKWRRKKISCKDRGTLRACLTRMPHVRKVYFITTALEKGDFRKLGWRKRADEKYKLRELVVALDPSPLERKRWEEERDKYKSAFA